MTDERSRYDADPPPPPESLVNTLPCERCGDPSTHFSPHSRDPLCWLCAAVEEEEVATKMLPTGTATGADVYELMERHRDRCYDRAAYRAAAELVGRSWSKKEWDEIWNREVDEQLAALVHRIRCNVTLSPLRGVDPIEVLERMLEE